MYFLLVIIIILILLSYVLFDRDIFSPSIITLFGFFISLLFGIYNQNLWNIEISTKLILIMSIGWSALFFGEFITRICYYKGRLIGGNNGGKKIELYQYKYLNINKMVTILLLAILFVILAMLWREILSISNSTSGEYDNAIGAYKDSEIGLSTFMVQAIKILKGAAYVFLIIFINNRFYNKINKISKKSVYIYMIPGIIYCVSCFIRGERYGVLAFILAGFLIQYLYVQSYHGWKFKFKLKHIFAAIFGLILIFYVFWAIKNFVGRDSDEDFLNYIGKYIGGSYKLFNLYLENPPLVKSNNTFAYLIESFNKIFNTNFNSTTYHEFRFDENGVLIGNVYTAYRNYYNDFGMLGVFGLSMLKSVIFSFWYITIKNKTNLSSYNVILFSSLYYTLLFDFFVDYFFARLSLGFFIEVIIMYVIYKVTTVKIKGNKFFE